METHPFHDYADQRNRAAALATGEWILSIDADERVTAELRDEILSATRGPAAGYTISRFQNFFGHWLRHGGFYPDRQLRLYRRSRGVWSGIVHERVRVAGAVQALRHPLIHRPYASLEEWIRALNRHSSLGALRVAENRAPASLRRAFTTAGSLFLRRLLIEQGFRDGGAGVIAAAVVAFEGFLVHAKHWISENPRGFAGGAPRGRAELVADAH